MELDEKKLLKDYINENGFFLHSDVKKLHRNDLKDISTNPHLGEGKKKKRVIKTSALLPEGDNILIFQGLTSQNFPPGEKSRLDMTSVFLSTSLRVSPHTYQPCFSP